MTTSKSMHRTDRKRLVIKLGGSMLAGLGSPFFQKLKEMLADGNELIIVHGGGPFINAALKENHVKTEIDNGIRITCKRSLDIAKQVLIGDVNTSLVHELNRNGITAIGLSGFDGQLLTCTLLDAARYGFVGDIKSVNGQLLNNVLAAGITPVISCIGAAECGMALNVNADTVASEVALAIEAESLLFVTDTPGIIIGNEFQHAASPKLIAKWIVEGEIHGGMIPKVKAATECLDAGIPSVYIADEKLTGTIIAYEEVFN